MRGAKGTRATRGGYDNRNSIRNRIHPNGHIIGGTHDKGLRYASAARDAGRGYFAQQVSLGNIVVTKRGNRIRYVIKKQPSVICCCVDELALLRARHFLRDEEKKWMTQMKFEHAFGAVYDNLVNAFKS